MHSSARGVADAVAILLLISASKCGLRVTKRNGMVNDMKESTVQKNKKTSPYVMK
jgi:hypothetical protein